MFDAPQWVQWLLFGLSVTAIGLIFLLSAVAAARQTFQFFPPPTKASWQHRQFLLLFRMYLYPLIGLSIFYSQPVQSKHAIFQYGIGGLLLLVGFGLAFLITFQMGWRNAFGERRGLKTNGWFSISRNPVYVATWIGLIGWGLLANNLLVTILLILWATMYLLAPVVEEPWLEKEYGEDYRAYKKCVRRFL